MNVFSIGKKFKEYPYTSEDEFEKDIITFHKLFFGEKTIYIDAKKKIESKSLGGTVPDGFFFDLSDISDPQFYIVEVELAIHSFYSHMFPQITKFFAFFKNYKTQKTLVEKIFSIVNTDNNLKKEFKKYIGRQEIFKFLSDIIDNNQNILLIIDGEKKELPEIMETYTDTWGKMVKHLTLKKYVHGTDDVIFTIDPDYEKIDYIEATVDEVEKTDVVYSEEFHLEGVNDNVKSIYQEIKRKVLSINDSLIFNPQKYYISIKTTKNRAYLTLRKKKIRLVAMLPEEVIKSNIKNYDVKTLSEGVQKFYNSPCAAIMIDDSKHLNEVIDILKILIEQE